MAFLLSLFFLSPRSSYVPILQSHLPKVRTAAAFITAPPFILLTRAEGIARTVARLTTSSATPCLTKIAAFIRLGRLKTCAAISPTEVDNASVAVALTIKSALLMFERRRLRRNPLRLASLRYIWEKGIVAVIMCQFGTVAHTGSRFASSQISLIAIRIVISKTSAVDTISETAIRSRFASPFISY